MLQKPRICRLAMTKCETKHIFLFFAILLSVRTIPTRHEKSTETMPCIPSPFTSKKVHKSRNLLAFRTIKDNLSSCHPSPFTTPPVTLDFLNGHEWLRKVMFPVLQTVIFTIMINRTLENSCLPKEGYAVVRLLAVRQYCIRFMRLDSCAVTRTLLFM